MTRSAAAQSAESVDGGFECFERIVPENCVEYMLFVIDTKLQPQQILSRLEAVRKTAIQLSRQLTSQYVWQRDCFNVEITTEKCFVYLHGITDYGDSVEDEWLIVYILRELTKQFPTLWVRVFDSDGEFLLVEAAKMLPKWLSPENDTNRAWIHGGQLRIIPPTSNGGGQSKGITISEAVGILQSTAETLVHSPFIESEAFYRLEKYPAQIQESLHHAMVSIPRRLAYLIHKVPEAIAPAVETFYLRDPIVIRPLMSPSAGPLVFPPEDFVDLSIKFTKVLYAQLKSQVFSPPPAWDIVPKKVAADNGSSVAKKQQDMLELGMKVTIGFEMLAKNAAKGKNRAAEKMALLLRDLEDGDSVLPSDADIASWKDCGRDDDDSWMNINFEDFEKELDGRAGVSKGSSSEDTSTHADLRNIVSRFEAFLNDEQAGVDGAEHDEMDEDDEDENDEDDDTDSEDQNMSFDEEEFARMMREMMGLPVDASKATHRGKGNKSQPATDFPGNDGEDKDIFQLSEQMKAELNEHGALELNHTPHKVGALRDHDEDKKRAGEQSGKVAADGSGEENSDDEVDIDYNLAKNILESFKGQVGMAGPVGTMLAGMGIRLPRDEDEESLS